MVINTTQIHLPLILFLKVIGRRIRQQFLMNAVCHSGTEHKAIEARLAPNMKEKLKMDSSRIVHPWW